VRADPLPGQRKGRGDPLRGRRPADARSGFPPGREARLGRQGRTRSEARPALAAPACDRLGRQPFQSNARRGRRHPLHRRATPRAPCQERQALLGTCAHGREALQLAFRPARERGAHAAPRPECRPAGHLPPRRRGQRPRLEGGRGGEPVTSELARAGGVIGAAGLAVLIVAPSRIQRLVGLGAWALGIVLLAAYLAPHDHRPLLAGAAVLGIALAVGGAWLFRRWPWLLPLVTLACIPARI